jgi:hypothetical protein
MPNAAIASNSGDEFSINYGSIRPAAAALMTASVRVAAANLILALSM